MTRATLAMADPFREPDGPSSRAWVRFVGRLIVFYAAVALLASALVILAAAAIALTIGHASAFAAPERPAPIQPHGCTIILPNTPGDRDVALVVRTTRPLSDCDESAPVAWGASIRDNAGGRR